MMIFGADTGEPGPKAFDPRDLDAEELEWICDAQFSDEPDRLHEVAKSFQEATEPYLKAGLQLLLQNTDVALRTLVMLSDYPHPQIRADVAAHPEASDDLLKDMFDDEDPLVRVQVATSTESSDLLVALADDEHFLVRWAVAINAETPDDVRDKLAEQDKDAIVREMARGRKSPSAPSKSKSLNSASMWS